MPVSGFLDALLRGGVLLPGIGSPRHYSFKPISTRDVSVNSCRHRRPGAWSVLGRRSPVRAKIDQDTAGEELIGGQLIMDVLNAECAQIPVNCRYDDGPFSNR